MPHLDPLVEAYSDETLVAQSSNQRYVLAVVDFSQDKLACKTVLSLDHSQLGITSIEKLVATGAPS